MKSIDKTKIGLLLAAILIGVLVVNYAAGPDSQEKAREGSETAVGQPKATAKDVATGTKELAEQGALEAKEFGETVAEHAKDVARKTTEVSKEVATKTKEVAQETWDKLKVK